MTTIIDYGIGNLRSLAKAFDAAGVEVRRSGDPAEIEAAERLVLPGVGAFGACADELKSRGLDQVVRQRAAAGVPLLGVCVGMQLLFESSDERGDHAGLGLIPGHVTRFPSDLTAPRAAGDASPPAEARRLKVPHIGWNRLETRRPHPVLGDGGDWVYFVHAYHAAPADDADLIATADYGLAVPAVVGRGNLVGVQFHPEKSARAGQAMLRRFSDWVPMG